MRVYVILAFSLTLFILGVEHLISEWRESILYALLMPGKKVGNVMALILIIPSLLGFFYLWKNDAFKKK